MTDANLVRVLQRQCRRRVGLIEHAVVRAGRAAIDPPALADGDAPVAAALDWAARSSATSPCGSAPPPPPDAVRAVQARLGVQRAGELVEAALAHLAQGLVDAGVRRLVVAGGETSGACVQALGVRRLRIGAQIGTGASTAPPRRAASSTRTRRTWWR